MNLRPPLPDERAALLALMEDFNRVEQIAFSRERTGPALARLLGDPNLGAVVVAEDSGALAGYAVVTYGFDLEWAGRDAFLTELYVAPQSRRSGVGAALLGEAERVARANGAAAIHLGVLPGNRPAHALYQRAGFQSMERVFLTKHLA
jgi:ribosomal protein S18 acetylase RimI-like enzyme